MGVAFSFSPHPHGAPSEQTRRGFQLFIEALANRLGCRHAADPEQFSRVEPNAQETVQIGRYIQEIPSTKAHQARLGICVGDFRVGTRFPVEE